MRMISEDEHSENLRLREDLLLAQEACVTAHRLIRALVVQCGRLNAEGYYSMHVPDIAFAVADLRDEGLSATRDEIMRSMVLAWRPLCHRAAQRHAAG